MKIEEKEESFPEFDILLVLQLNITMSALRALYHSFGLLTARCVSTERQGLVLVTFDWFQVEGRNICIYGSDNPDWIREFNAQMKEIRSVGVQIEMVYVGSRHLSERESMRRSIFRPQQSISSDHIQEAVSALLDSTDEGWAVIGKGNTTDIVKLHGTKTMECLNKFSGWEENVIKLGFLGALRSAPEEAAPLPGPCNNSNIVPYNYQLKKL
ncbi:hypothetical protein GH714_028852 [Hevea brasiliensis]|uniref:Sieve element occlusion C-terminal domain-containing protein n=1 Tax=Hevea brasiliensis TaxID=3981 RepID=A0A6A6LNA7_HEVBR|nr:hypothetical protein GH714_028852 [Hevea brasiliensis]